VSSFLIGTLDLCEMFGSRLYHNFFAGSNPGDRQKNRGDKWKTITITITSIAFVGDKSDPTKLGVRLFTP